MKYTPLGGHVEIRASKRDDDVLVEIKDDGVGIPTKALSHIFEEFYRADNVKTQAVEGTGLGLSIVKQILDTHGGKIWIKTKQDQGTTFSFTLLVAGDQHA